MITWLANNYGTVIVALIVFGMLTAITVKLIKDKKKGRSSCGCGCENCAMSDACHKKADIT